MQNKKKILSEWVLLTALGWWLGCFYLFTSLFLFSFVAHALNIDLSFLGIGVFFGMPFGFCIGIVQWKKLSHWNIHRGKWLLVTSLGWGIFFTGFSFVLALYRVPPLLSTFCLVLTLLLGGFVLGTFQVMALKTILLNPRKWVLANTFGLPVLAALTFGVYSLAYAFKSVFLKFFYSHQLYNLVDMRDYLLFGLLVLVMPVLSAFSLGVLTGKVLITPVNHSNDA